jgi:EpsI family protein
MRLPIAARAAVTVAAVLATHAYLVAAQKRVPRLLARPLSSVPMTIDGWRGADQAPLDAETLRILRADDYLNRVYIDPAGRGAGLYIAFYAAQGTGDSIHSPLHCLPGNGWRPVSASRVALRVEGRTLVVNRLVVEKAMTRQLVLYWFEGRGRSIASEYENRAWLIWDGLRRGRSEGALVRITTPVSDTESAAESAAAGFAREAFARIREVLP